VVAIDHTSIDPKRLVVQAWTSQCDNRYADGTWHTVDLTYVGEEHDGSGMVRHVYGQSDIITSDRDFEFTYCLRVNYVTFTSASVGSFVCQQYYAKTTHPIFSKFGGKVAYELCKKSLASIVTIVVIVSQITNSFSQALNNLLYSMWRITVSCLEPRSSRSTDLTRCHR